MPKIVSGTGFSLASGLKEAADFLHTKLAEEKQAQQQEARNQALLLQFAQAERAAQIDRQRLSLVGQGQELQRQQFEAEKQRAEDLAFERRQIRLEGRIQDDKEAAALMRMASDVGADPMVLGNLPANARQAYLEFSQERKARGEASGLVSRLQRKVETLWPGDDKQFEAELAPIVQGIQALSAAGESLPTQVVLDESGRLSQQWDAAVRAKNARAAIKTKKLAMIQHAAAASQAVSQVGGKLGSVMAAIIAYSQSQMEVADTAEELDAAYDGLVGMFKQAAYGASQIDEQMARPSTVDTPRERLLNDKATIESEEYNVTGQPVAAPPQVIERLRAQANANVFKAAGYPNKAAQIDELNTLLAKRGWLPVGASGAAAGNAGADGEVNALIDEIMGGK